MKDDEHINIPGWLKALVVLSLLVAVISVGAYVYAFRGSLSGEQEVWGMFGDFIGGTLNPLFALTGLFALLYTIKQQSQELRNSAKQLKKSAEALQAQNETLKTQRFEATFFQLFRLFGDVIQDLNFVERERTGNGLDTEIVEYQHRRCLEKLYKNLHRIHQKKESEGIGFASYMSNGEFGIDFYRETYSLFYEENEQFVGHYFRMLNSSLDFIDRGDIPEDEKKYYTNLARAQLSKYELGLLLYHCISEDSDERLISLVRQYDLLEYLEDGILHKASNRDFINEK